MKRFSTALTMILVMIVSGFLWVVSQIAYNTFPFLLILYVRDVFLLLFVHLLITHLCAPIIFIIFRKKFNYNNFWFRPKKIEIFLYKFLRVRKWKSKIVVYDKNQFSLTLHSAEEVVYMMCHAELVHEFIAICSFLPAFLSMKGVNFILIIITSIIFAIIHLMCSIVQRYNRPYLVKFINRRNKKA